MSGVRGKCRGIARLKQQLEGTIANGCHLCQVAAEKEAAREAGEEDDGPLEVQGFLFRRLLARAPGARQELLSFRDHLLASAASDADEALKVRGDAPACVHAHGERRCRNLCLLAPAASAADEALEAGNAPAGMHTGTRGLPVCSPAALEQSAQRCWRACEERSQALRGGMQSEGAAGAFWTPGRAQVWNMKDLGLQAAQRIAAALDPLHALGEVAQNFPNLAAPLSRVAVAAPLRAELQQLHRLIPGGAPLTSCHQSCAGSWWASCAVCWHLSSALRALPRTAGRRLAPVMRA